MGVSTAFTIVLLSEYNVYLTYIYRVCIVFVSRYDASNRVQR